MSTPNPLAILGGPYTGTAPFPLLPEVRARLGIAEGDTSKDAQIAATMQSTIALVEGYLGRGIANVPDFTQVFEPVDTRDRRLFLSRFPVQSVTSVTIDDGAAAPGAWRLFGKQGVLELGDGCAAHFCARLPIITVVYSGGYPDEAWPADLLDAVMQVFYGRWARANSTDPAGASAAPVRSWTADGLTISYADANVGMGSAYASDVIPPEIAPVAAMLDPYRRRNVWGV